MKEASATRPLVCLLRDPAVPDPYKAALEEVGFRTVSVPVLRFALVRQAALRAALRRPSDYGGLILTSPRAAEAVSRAGNVVAGWAEKPVFVVGPRTAEAVRALGLRPEGADASHAEALAARITLRSFAAPLLFLCGDRRREVLPDRLRAADTPFRELCVYETRLRADLDFAAYPGVAWLVFFSPSGVEAMRQARGIPLGSIQKAAVGPTTAEALHAAGWPVAAVAAAPTPGALAVALQAAQARPWQGR